MNLFFKRNFGSDFFLLVKNPKPSIGRIACMIVNSYKNGQNIKNILEGTGEKRQKLEGIRPLHENYIYLWLFFWGSSPVHMEVRTQAESHSHWIRKWTRAARVMILRGKFQKGRKQRGNATICIQPSLNSLADLETQTCMGDSKEPR